MPQLSLYLDNDMMEELRNDAASENKSLSRFVVDILQERKQKNQWPDSFFELYGALKSNDHFLAPEDDLITSNEIAPLDLR